VTALVAVLAVLAAAWFGGRALPGRGSARAIERIAVLPMDNQTGDSTQSFFADGMTRELIGVLTEAGVRVLGHRAVAGYKGSTLSSAEIAKALGVDAIVTGAMLKAGDEIQVAAELTDPATGENLWARTFSRPAAGVVALQREMASEIARGIRARLTPAQAERLGEARPVDPRAYTQYLLGMEQANLRTPAGFDRSLAYLRRSVTLDSTFAPAWAAMALSSVYALIYQTAPRDSARPLLELAARRARALDDRIGDPYFALGAARIHMDWDFAGADSLYREGRTRTLSAQALGLFGWTAWEMGRYREIETSTGTLVELEPTTAQWRSDRAWGYWSARDTARARASAERAVQVDSTFYEAHDILSLIEMDAGNFAAADREHRRAILHAGGDYWVRQFNDAMIAAARGDTASVRRIARELEGDPRLAQRAGIQYLAGNTDSMYALFDRAIRERDPDVLQIINAMPILYPARKDPRYQALLARIGLPEDLR
jgi:TolB-like protein/tetratricopeptide (TPR) repeat protein